MATFTRRETVAMLLSAVPSLSLASLVGCTCGTRGPGGGKNDTPAMTSCAPSWTRTA